MSGSLILSRIYCNLETINFELEQDPSYSSPEIRDSCLRTLYQNHVIGGIWVKKHATRTLL